MGPELSPSRNVLSQRDVQSPQATKQLGIRVIGNSRAKLQFKEAPLIKREDITMATGGYSIER